MTEQVPPPVSPLLTAEMEPPLSRTRTSIVPRKAALAVSLACTLGLSTLAGAANVTWNEPPPSGGYGQQVTQGAAADGNVLSLNARWWPWSPGPGGRLGALPQGLSFDHVVDDIRKKKTILSIPRHSDSSTVQPNNLTMVSEDNGREFFADRSQPKTFSFGASNKLADGSLIGVGGYGVRPAGATTFTLATHRSNDLGKTWKTSMNPLTENLYKMAWYAFTGRKIIELGDGTLLLATYGVTMNNGPTRTVLLQSTDGGNSWSQRSAIHSGPGGTVNCSSEAALEHTSDGRLIAVTRSCESSATPTLPMGVQFSDDGGKTWSERKIFVPPAGLPDRGIMPHLNLQANGAMVLSYGRPDNYVAVSWDGTGRTWDDGKLVFSNHIRTTSPGRWYGSSGNTSLLANTANSSMYYGDSCHNEWSCYEYGQQNGVFAQQVDVVKAGTGKIDLEWGVRKGTMKLTAGVVPADARFPEQRLAGAVDGSNELRAAARFAAGAVTGSKGLTLDLGRAYTLDKIGLMLDRGVANSARIQVSLDGKHYQTVASQVNSTDYALRYHQLDTPVRAMFVRIVGGPNAPLTAVNELELYAAGMNTFENDATNAAPRGSVDAKHALVNEPAMNAPSAPVPNGVWAQTGANSRQWLMLYDHDPQDVAHVTFPTKPATGLDVSFDYSGQGYGSGAIWTIGGKNAAGAPVTAWKFHLSADWNRNAMKISTWNGSAWEVAGYTPGITTNWYWMNISTQITTSDAAITINGSTVRTTVRAGEASTLDSFTPSTGLQASDINLNHGYDNLSITALPPTTITSVQPTSLWVLPHGPSEVAVTVHNNTTSAQKLRVRTEVSAGYSLDNRQHVQVPANGDATVIVKVRASANAPDGRLVVQIGDDAVAVTVRSTDDLARAATMTASSSTAQSSPTNLNSGNTSSSIWGGGGAGAWNDNTGNTFPDWVQATWASPVPLTKVVVHTLDSASYPAARYGVRDYQVQVLDAAGAWKTVATVSGNTQGVITSTFPKVSTAALRLLITDSNNHDYSRLVAVQAYGS